MLAVNTLAKLKRQQQCLLLCALRQFTTENERPGRFSGIGGDSKSKMHRTGANKKSRPVEDRRPLDGSRPTHYADLRKNIAHENPPLFNKMDKIQKSIGRMDDSRPTIVSGASKFFRNLVLEKTGM